MVAEKVILGEVIWLKIATHGRRREAARRASLGRFEMSAGPVAEWRGTVVVSRPGAALRAGGLAAERVLGLGVDLSPAAPTDKAHSLIQFDVSACSVKTCDGQVEELTAKNSCARGVIA